MTWHGDVSGDGRWYQSLSRCLMMTLFAVVPFCTWFSGHVAAWVALPLLCFAAFLFLLGFGLLLRWSHVWRLPPRRQGVVRLEAPSADEEAPSAIRADGTSDARS